MTQKDPWHKIIGIATVVIGTPSALLGMYGIYLLAKNAGPSFSPLSIKIYSSLLEVTDVPKMTVRYGGSTSFAPLRKPKEMWERIQKTHPDFKLIYVDPIGKSPGSTTGIGMLLNDSLTFAESSRPLEPKEYDEAKGRNFSLEQRQVAYDGVVFYVNPSLNLAKYPRSSLPGLTIKQLKKVLTGEIVNWKDFDGPDIPITVFTRDPKSGGTPDFIQRNVMGGQKFSDSAQIENNTTLSINSVAKTPGGIGYATASETCNQETIKSVSIATDEKPEFISPCNSNKETNEVNISVLENSTYSLVRPMFVIIKKDGGSSEKAGVAYTNILLSREGQLILKRAGLAPIHNEK